MDEGERALSEAGARRVLAGAAFVVFLGNAASRLLGLARDQVIAFFFGASALTSAYVVAQTPPLVFYELLVGGAVSAALVPVLSAYAVRDPSGYARLLGAALVLAAGVLGVAVGLALLGAAPLTSLLAGGLSPATQAEALALVRLALPSLFFMGLAGVATAGLYAQGRFALPALAAASYNGAVVLAVPLLAPAIGIQAVALGLVTGAVAQCALALLGLWRAALRPRLAWGHPGLGQMARLYLPVALGLLAAQAGVVLDRRLASGTGEASLAVMRFATTLVQLPLGLVVTALAVAILPHLARLAAQDAGPRPGPGFRTMLATGMRFALALMLPATVGLIALRAPIVRLLFEYGRFDATATERTALAFLIYAPQLPFVALDQLLVFAFYARQHTLAPNLVALAALGVYVAVALPARAAWGMEGLVLANTAQNVAHALLMLALLHWRLGGLSGVKLGRSLVALLLGALAVYPAAGLVAAALEPAASSVAGRLAQVGAGIGAGVLAYAAVLRLLRVEEAAALGHLLGRALGRR